MHLSRSLLAAVLRREFSRELLDEIAFHHLGIVCP